MSRIWNSEILFSWVAYSCCFCLVSIWWCQYWTMNNRLWLVPKPRIQIKDYIDMSQYLFRNLPQGSRLNSLPWGWISGPQILKNEDELVLAFKPSVLSHSQDSIYYPPFDDVRGPQFVFWKDSGNKNVQIKSSWKKLTKTQWTFLTPFGEICWNSTFVTK